MRALVLAICTSLIAPWAGAQTNGSLNVTTSTAERVEQIDQQRLEAAVEKVKPSLVRIQVVEAEYYEGREHKQEASGSGAIISADGYVVTNHHVAGKSVRLVCTMFNREEVPAVLIGTDPLSDISVIQLRPAKPRSWPFVRWGDSGKLEVGDPVLAMGSPLALSQSVTRGIISNSQMTMPTWAGGMELDGEDVGSIVRWLGHDAQIFPGNSGGPLVNLDGDIVGINEISFGLGGAIPAAIAYPIANTLIRNHKIDRAFLGLMLQPSFKFESGNGAIISDVIKNSPCAKAGLKPGDRLVLIQGRDQEMPVQIRFAEELPPLNLWLATQPLGIPLTLKIARDSTTITTTVAPVLREPVLRQRREFKQWGITARDLSIWTALEMKRANTEGVLVTSVRPGGPAGQAKPDMEAQDIVLKINDRKIANMDEFNTYTLEITKDKKEPVPALVAYARKGETLMTVVEVGLQELDDPGANARKAWLPVGLQALTQDLAKQLGQEGKTGVIVTEVYKIAKTTGTLGLQVGDIVLTLDGDVVEVSEQNQIENFTTRIKQYKIGKDIKLGILRGGQPMEVGGKLISNPYEPREMKRYQDFEFEFTARDTAYMDRVGKQLEDEVRGVQIDAVEDGGWAALARLAAGDTLLSVDGQPTPDVVTLRGIMEKIKEAKHRHVIFKIRRGVHTLFVELEPLWEKPPALKS